MQQLAEIVGIFLWVLGYIPAMSYVVWLSWRPGRGVVIRLREHGVSIPWLFGRALPYLLSRTWLENHVLQNPRVPDELKEEAKEAHHRWRRYGWNAFLLTCLAWVVSGIAFAILIAFAGW